MLSLARQGRTPRNLGPRKRRMADGISVFDIVGAAEEMAREMRGKLGWHLAELAIPDDGPITYELTGHNGHYTLWGEADTILSYIVRVTPIAGGPTVPESD